MSEKGSCNHEWDMETILMSCPPQVRCKKCYDTKFLDEPSEEYGNWKFGSGKEFTNKTWIENIVKMQERESIQSKLAPIVQEYGIEKVDAALQFCRKEHDSCAFEKKLNMSSTCYGDLNYYITCFERLLVCMKETNKQHEKICEFFRLTFRSSDPFKDNSGSCPYVMEFRWGDKNEK